MGGPCHFGYRWSGFAGAAGSASIVTFQRSITSILAGSRWKRLFLHSDRGARCCSLDGLLSSLARQFIEIKETGQNAVIVSLPAFTTVEIGGIEYLQADL